MWGGGYMALFYKRNETQTIGTKQVARPGLLRIATTLGVSGTRLSTYLLMAHSVSVQTFGLLLLLQWLSYAPLPLLGIGIDPVARRRIIHIQGQEPIYSAARIFRFLWHKQSYRILYYIATYLPLAYMLSFASHRLLSLPLLLLAGLTALPLLMNSIVGIALQSQERYQFLSLLSILNALLTLSLVSLVPLWPTTQRLELLLLLPAVVNGVTLVIALGYLARLLPFRGIPPVGPLLKQKIWQAARVSPLLFFMDIWTWRELPLLLLFLLYWHTHNSLLDLTCYTFSLLLCTRLTEVAPTYFSTCLLPASSPLYERLFKRPLALNSYDAFVQATCYISLLATFSCTLLTIFCPQLIVATLGPTYLPMVKMLRILLIAVVFSSIATVSLTHLERRRQLSTQYVLYPPQAGQQALLRRHLYVRIGTVALYILLAIPCMTLWGLTGAALASMLVRVGFALCSIVQCHHLLRTYPSLPSSVPVTSYIERRLS